MIKIKQINNKIKNKGKIRYFETFLNKLSNNLSKNKIIIKNTLLKL